MTRRGAGSIPAGDNSFSDLGLSITIDQNAEKTLLKNSYVLWQYMKPSGAVRLYENGKEVFGKTPKYQHIKELWSYMHGKHRTNLYKQLDTIKNEQKSALLF